MLTAYQKYVVDWDDFNPAHLSNTKNTITQEYDALNRIRKAIYPEDIDERRKEMIPKYNKGGALLSLKMDEVDYVKEVAYNARGQRILIAMGNDIMTRYAYDPETFRVSRQRSELYTCSEQTYVYNGGVQHDLQYTYDLEGTIKSINDAAPANTSAEGPGDLLRVFNHDPLRRLMSATGRESSNVYRQPSWDLNVRPHDHTLTNMYLRTYAYDKLGNILSLNHHADGHSNQDFGRDYSYLGTDNRLNGFLVSSNLYAFQYDANGNLTKEGESRYFEWSANDKLSVFKDQAGSSTPSVYTNYFYNSQGERVKKHTRKGNKVIVTFYMDGGMFETTYTKTVGGSIDNDRFYNTIKVQDGGALIATILVGKNVDDSTPDVQYIIGDHLNNSSVVLTTSGSLINREEYYPFGETSFGSFKFKRYRYNGKEKDEESGLYEYGQRYYAPWLCRFVSVDPIAEDYPQLSSYNYAGNKPITSRDIEGLQSEVDAPTKSSTQSQTNAKANNDGLLNIEVHQVKQGETISGLSKEYGVSQDAIRAANPQTQERSQTDQINIGEDIVIPMNSLPDSSSFGDYNSRDAEGLKHIPFDSDYQKNLERQFQSQGNTSTNEELVEKNNFTFHPEFTFKFEFGVGATIDTPLSLAGGTANYSSLTLVGLVDNDFYFAGRNYSQGGDIREINEEYSFSAEGYGISHANVYKGGRKGEKLKSVMSFQLFQFFQIKQIEDFKEDITIQQASFNVSIGFGLILMPQAELNLILFTDTIR